MKGKDFYQILGLKLEATQKEIKHAYRLLARKYHPDVSKVRNAEEKFKTMGEAYEVLKNPKTRKEYDRLNSRKPKKKRAYKKAYKPSSKRKSSYGFNEARFNEKHAADLNSFFEDQFGVNQKSTDRNSFDIEGKDIHARLMIDLEHSLNGASQQFTVEIPMFTPQGELINKKKILSVRIPRGIKEGDIIRLAKQGSPGMGAAAGDFLLEVVFNKHDHYTIEGNNIYLKLPVSSCKLELGAKIQVPSPNRRLGKITMTIPENSYHGAKLRFKGHGLPNQKPGDFYVILQVA